MNRRCRTRKRTESDKQRRSEADRRVRSEGARYSRRAPQGSHEGGVFRSNVQWQEYGDKRDAEGQNPAQWDRSHHELLSTGASIRAPQTSRSLTKNLDFTSVPGGRFTERGSVPDFGGVEGAQGRRVGRTPRQRPAQGEAGRISTGARVLAEESLFIAARRCCVCRFAGRRRARRLGRVDRQTLFGR